MAYFALLEALRAAQGCPLCEMESEGVRRYLDGVLYESVNDPGVRAALAEAHGYCRRHAHALLGLMNGMGTGILYRDQVELFMDFLGGLDEAATPRLRKRRPANWERDERCPACRIQLDGRMRNIHSLVEWLGDEELRAAFDVCPGLCVPHFLLALGAVRNGDIRRYLIETERRKFEQLRHELEEFARKHDYRYSREGFGKEGDSWLRAVRMMVGEREVFP